MSTHHPELVAHPSWGRRLIGIEGLRGFAALAVVFRHVGQHLYETDDLGFIGYLSTIGAHGLTLFFALSGFLLFRPFAASIVDRAPLPSLGRYAFNRALRILPAYVVIFLVASFVFGTVYTVGAPGVFGYDNIGRLTDPAVIFANLFLVQTYIPSMVLTGLGTAWSLTTEIAFYIALPLLALGASLAARKLNRWVAVLVGPATLILLGLVSTAVSAKLNQGETSLQWGHNWTSVFDRSLLVQADLFGYGMLAAVVVLFLQRRGLTSIAAWVPPTTALTAVAVAWMGITFGGPLKTNVVGVASGLLILAVVLPASNAGAQGNRLARALEWLPIRYLGLISYSVYLWHLPIVLWLHVNDIRFGEGLGGLLLTALVVAVVTLALSSLTYFFVERPAMNLKLRQRIDPAQQRDEAAARRERSQAGASSE